MTDQSSTLSRALVRGEIDDSLLRMIASIGPSDIDPTLEKTMLMTLSDTTDGRLRNVLALALAKVKSQEAVPRLISLLNDQRTRGYRSTILYALQKFNIRLPVRDLIFLILFDTPETQEEAFSMLRKAIPRAQQQDRVAALEWTLDSLNTSTNIERSKAAKDALKLLLDSPLNRT